MVDLIVNGIDKTDDPVPYMTLEDTINSVLSFQSKKRKKKRKLNQKCCVASQANREQSCQVFSQNQSTCHQITLYQVIQNAYPSPIQSKMFR